MALAGLAWAQASEGTLTNATYYQSSRVVGRGMKGRVLRAHEAVAEAQNAARKQKTLGEDSGDLDVLLDANGIKAMIVRFWNRHKVKIPSVRMPGDQAICRVAREMERRFLHIAEVLKIKGVELERRAQQRKKGFGGGLTYT